MISNSAASAEWRKRMCHASELPESKRNRSSTPHSPSTASTPVKSGVVKISGPAAGCSGNSASAPSSIVDCVLVVLGECEQQMRSMRSLCNAESEAFNGNCGAVLEDILALQFRASEIIRARQGTTRDPPLAHSAACSERGAWQHVGDANLLADICWFRQVARAISKTKHLITNYKEALLCIKTLKQKDAAREDDTSERQGEGSAVTRVGDKQNGLMAVMQRLGTLAWGAGDCELSAHSPLGECANEAGDWACVASEQLRQMLCAQDDALVKISEHVAKQNEEHGNTVIERGDAMLRLAQHTPFAAERERIDVVNKAMLYFVQAEAAYEEAHGINVFAAHRPPQITCPVPLKGPEKGACDHDILAVAGRFRDLTKDRMALQTKLRAIQRDVQLSTRRLQCEQRCFNVWQLINVQLRLNRENGSIAPDHREQRQGNAVTDEGVGEIKGTGKTRVGAEAGAAEISGQHTNQGDEKQGMVVGRLEEWIADSTEHLHVRCLVRVREALEKEIKQIEMEENDLEQLQNPFGNYEMHNGGGEVVKKGHAALDSGFAEFCQNELCAITRRRAMCYEACSAIKLYFTKYNEACNKPETSSKELGDEDGRHIGSVSVSPAAAHQVRAARTSLLHLVEEIINQTQAKGGNTRNGQAGKGNIERVTLEQTAVAKQLHQQQFQQHEVSHRSMTTLVMYSAAHSRCFKGAMGEGGNNRHHGKAVFVSGEVDSASEACVEYLQGVNTLLDRQVLKSAEYEPTSRRTHVLLSGDVLGDIKLVDAGEMEFAIDAECTACEMLLRVVFAARGLHDMCDVRGQLADMERALSYCKGVCRAVDLVADTKVANAVILNGPVHALMCRKAAEAALTKGTDNSVSVPDGNGNGDEKAGDDGEAMAGMGAGREVAPIEGSEIEILLTCVCAYARMRHPWLRRIAVVNLAGHEAVSKLTQSEELLLLHAFPPPSSAVLTSKAKDPHSKIDRMNSNDSDATRAAVAAAAEKGRHFEVEPMQVSEDKEGVLGMVQNASYKPLNSNIRGGNELAAVGEKRVKEKISTETRGANNVREGQGLRMDMQEHAAVGGGASGSSSIDINTSSADARSASAHGCTGQRHPMAQGSLSAKISFDLRAFCPDFIFVVYDKDSRHHAESAAEQKKTNASHEHQVLLSKTSGSGEVASGDGRTVAGESHGGGGRISRSGGQGGLQAGDGEAGIGPGNSQRFEHNSWKQLCSLARHVVKDAEELCNRNIIFLEMTRDAKATSSMKARELLAHVRTSGSIVEAALGGGGLVCGSNGEEDEMDTDILLPWPMPYRGTSSECKQLAAILGWSHEKAEVNMDITYETLSGTPNVEEYVSSCEMPFELEESATAWTENGGHADVHGAKCDAELPFSVGVNGNFNSNTGIGSNEDSKPKACSIQGTEASGGKGQRHRSTSEPDNLQMHSKKRDREALDQGRGSPQVGIGKLLRAIKPHDAVIEALRGKPEGLTLDELVQCCQQLPRKLDLGTSLPGTQGLDARGALRHALTAGCNSSGSHLHRRPAAFVKIGERYQLVQEVGRDAGVRDAAHRGIIRHSDSKQHSHTTAAKHHRLHHTAAEMHMKTTADSASSSSGVNGKSRGSAATKDAVLALQQKMDRKASYQTITLNEPEASASSQLLDLADRIPYNSVRESTASVWDNFRVKTQNCKTPADLAQQLVWFAQQVLPRVLRATWSFEIWRAQCWRCTQEADVLAVLKDFEVKALDWEKVAAAFREEWQAHKMGKGKHKKMHLSMAEEIALAATFQLGLVPADQDSLNILSKLPSP